MKRPGTKLLPKDDTLPIKNDNPVGKKLAAEAAGEQDTPEIPGGRAPDDA